MSPCKSSECMLSCHVLVKRSRCLVDKMDVVGKTGPPDLERSGTDNFTLCFVSLSVLSLNSNSKWKT